MTQEPADDSEATKVSTVADPPAELATRGNRAYLIVLAGSNVGEMYRVDEGETFVGRGQNATIRLNDDGISRRHARLVQEGGKVVIQDLGSSNGTAVNGVALAGQQLHRLQDGDKIRLGSTTILKFTYNDHLDESFRQQMYDAALRDGLTKAFNRKYFLDRLETEIAYARKHRAYLSLLMFDVDHFKRVNDTYGHLAGDFVLSKLAKIAHATVRPEDVFARYGGEEFSVIQRGFPLASARILAERLRMTVEATPFEHEGARMRITISVGVAAYPDLPIEEGVQLIAGADEALYEAKRSGRNRVLLKRGEPGGLPAPTGAPEPARLEQEEPTLIPREDLRSSWPKADPIDVFVSCATEDEPLRRDMDKRLIPLQRSSEIRVFSASQLPAGAKVRAEMDSALDAARVFLLLVSADFLASNDCDAEVARAMKRHRNGEALVLPIILRDCDWRSAPFGQLSELPRGSRAITSAPNQDQAWAETIAGVRAAITWRKGSLWPSYPDPVTRVLCDQMVGARDRQRRLREQGEDTSAVDREILDLRRRLREGGQLRAGDSLGDGRYLLLKQIGRGGFAIVWEAHDWKRHERVAVKVLHSNLVGDPIRLERFFRGARRMAQLDHEGVVRVTDQGGEDGGYHYFVMEFIPGGDFRQAVLQKALQGEAVLRVVLRAGEALAAAHAKGLVHRDVKPANILLDAAGAPRLTDFDLVGAADTTGGTKSGAIGTVVYTAPEITDRPQDADARADVYSLGMTALFGLHGAELSMLTVRNLEQLVDKLGCSEGVKAVLLRALDWDSEKRYKDAQGFCDALRTATTG